MTGLGLAASPGIRCRRTALARPYGGSSSPRGLVVDNGVWVEIRGGRVLVDASTVEWLSQWNWHVHTLGYAGRARLASDPPGGHEVYLHRELLGLRAGDGLQADHINRDRLDNRRANLRIVTPGDNRQNTPAIAGRFRGVGYDRARRRWRAQAQFKGHHYFLGRFATEEQAAQVASDWRREHMPFSNEDSQ